jgi:predicted MPP superfamily phosphohydrolase
MDTLFRWIHLSDIHTGHGDRAHGWDQSLVLAAIVTDIAAQRARQPEPPIDAVFVTGDIANTGAGRTPTEYEMAATWLDKVAVAAGVAPEQIFLVPGNHDVDRGADKDDAVKQLVAELREGKKSLDDALAEAAPRAVLARRIARYLDFAGRFAPVGATPDDRLHWVHRFIARSGLPVRLVGLTTTLLAAGDDDQGKLRVGMRQIGLGFADMREGELVLALGHHPLGGGWLFDQPEIEPWLKRHAHALLTGHVHVADAQESRGGSGATFLRVVAGSAHGDRMPAGIPAGHGYSFGAVVRLDEGAVHARITPRRWSEKNAAFVRDADNIPDDETFSDHPLALSRPRAAAAVSSAPKPAGALASSGEPVPIFISATPEDEAMRAQLQKHLVQLRRSKKAVFTYSSEAPAGVDRAEWTAAELARARIIVLLISPDYIASDAYYEDDLLRAVERHDRGEARVIPVVLHAIRLSKEPFAKLRSLPSDAIALHQDDEARLDFPRGGCAVDQYPRGEDAAFLHIATEIGKVTAELRGEGNPRR